MGPRRVKYANYLLVAAQIGCDAATDGPPPLSEEIECRFGDWGHVEHGPARNNWAICEERWDAYDAVSAGSGVPARVTPSTVIRTQMSCRLGSTKKEHASPMLWYRSVVPWTSAWTSSGLWEESLTCAMSDGRFQFDSDSGLHLFRVGADRDGDPAYPQWSDVFPGYFEGGEFVPGFEFKLQACAELRDGPVRLEMELIACPPTDLDCEPRWTLPSIRRFVPPDGYEDAPCW